MLFFFVSVGMVERIKSTYYHPSSEKRPRDKKTEEEKKRRRVWQTINSSLLGQKRLILAGLSKCNRKQLDFLNLLKDVKRWVLSQIVCENHFIHLSIQLLEKEGKEKIKNQVGLNHPCQLLVYTPYRPTQELVTYLP